ncbi:MAG: carboxypeptidase regulatory-like domain-containing protein, partial [Kiritimatiellae bacterium]|nr:carboxypeptidase regulatory-like domain-containing protein [Kiritimatiellia bacterium]
FDLASEPDLNGNFSASYTVTMRNVGGRSTTYNLTDTPAPDVNITVNGAVVTNYAALSFTNAGPYTLATGESIAAGATHTYNLTLDLTLGDGILAGTQLVSECVSGAFGFEANAGLFNQIVTVYGTNDLTITNTACGEIPPMLIIDKTFVSVSDLDGFGNFTATYEVVVANVGGTPTTYVLDDTPNPDGEVTIHGVVVTGYTNLSLSGPGTYALATNEPIAAVTNHVYILAVSGTLSPEAMAGTASVRLCGASQQVPVAGEGLFNEAAVVYGTNDTRITDSDCGDLPPIPRYDLVKTLISPTNHNAVIGEEFVFSLAVSNSGDVALGTVPLVDTFDTNLLAFVSATPSEDASSPGSLSWTNIGPLGLGQTASVTVRFTAVNLGTGTNTVVATPVTTNGIPLPPQTSSVPHTASASSISGSVFYDANVDGIFDPEDITNGISGVTITLLDATNGVVGVTTTDVNGAYTFTNLAAGSYTVQETDPQNFYSTADIVPPNDNLIPVNLGVNEDSTGNDFLDGEYASVGDFVWQELGTPNGIQDISETGPQTGVRVTLYDTNNVVIGITTSSVQLVNLGEYGFTNVVPGDYYIMVSRPLGFGFTEQFVGTNTAIDSDVDILTMKTPVFTLLPGQNETTIDAGLYEFVNLAQVAAFSGGMEQGQPTLRWTTDSEVGTAGWYIERSEDGLTWTRVSDYLPSSGGMQLGADYVWVDVSAKVGHGYRYQLIEVEAQGAMRPYGPYEITFKASRSGRASLSVSADAAYGWDVHALPAAASPVTRMSLVQDESSDAVKVAVSGSGFVRISEASIASILGIPATDLANSPLRLLNLGIEVPMVREAGDVVFYAHAYQNQFTLENIYRIEIGAGSELASAEGAPSAVNATESFLDTVVAERNLILRSDIFSDASDDLWLWSMIISGMRNEFSTSIDLPNVVPASGGQLMVALKGAVASAGRYAHRAEILLNGQLLGTVDFNGLERVEATLDVPAGLMVSGANMMTVRSAPPAGTAYDTFYVDRAEITYERGLIAVEDQLEFTLTEGPAVVGGLSGSDAEVWLVSDAWNPVQITGGEMVDNGASWSLAFDAPVAGRYAVRVSGSEDSPSNLTGWMESDLKSTGHRIDYLVIYGEGLAAGAEALAADRSAKGLASKVVSVDEIFNSFNHGIRDPRAIKSFLGYAYRMWAQAPRYVALAGAGSIDYHDNLGQGECLVPALPVGGKYGVFASDNRLGDVNGDGLSEYAVGRIPVRSAEQLASYVAKLQAFEVGGAWRDQVAILTDNSDQGGNYVALADTLAGLIDNHAIARMDAEVVGALAARDQWIGHLNSGYELGLYIGHGTVQRMAEEGLLLNSDVSGLGNQSSAGVVGAFGCLMGVHGMPGTVSVGEQLVLSAGGASAVIGSGTMVNSADSQLIAESLVAATYQQGVARLGDAWLNAKAQATAAGRSQVAEAYQLLGDPATAMGSATASRGGPAVAPARGEFGEWLAWAFAPAWHDLGLVGGLYENPDKDSLNNWEEFIAGTDPDDQSSEFVVLEVMIAADGRVTLNWPSVAGRSYRIERAALSDGRYEVIAEQVSASGTGENLWVDEDPITEAAYYRVLVY